MTKIEFNINQNIVLMVEKRDYICNLLNYSQGMEMVSILLLTLFKI